MSVPSSTMFLGQRGSGKSSIINKLIGIEKFLPTAESRLGTASVVEVIQDISASNFQVNIKFSGQLTEDFFGLLRYKDRRSPDGIRDGLLAKVALGTLVFNGSSDEAREIIHEYTADTPNYFWMVVEKITVRGNFPGKGFHDGASLIDTPDASRSCEFPFPERYKRLFATVSRCVLVRDDGYSSSWISDLVSDIKEANIPSLVVVPNTITRYFECCTGYFGFSANNQPLKDLPGIIEKITEENGEIFKAHAIQCRFRKDHKNQDYFDGLFAAFAEDVFAPSTRVFTEEERNKREAAPEPEGSRKKKKKVETNGNQ